MGSQTAVFRRIVRDHMGGAAVVVHPGQGCEAVVARMAAAGASSAVVIGPDGRPIGIVTEQDVTRRIACRRPAAGAIETVMTAPVHTVRDDDRLYHAIARMRRAGLRHMPVVDPAGRVCGLLDLHHALAVASARTVGLIDRLTHGDGLDELGRVKAAEVEVAEALFADSVPVPDIQSVLTGINNDLYRRVAARCLDAMAAAGSGPPPVPFAVLVLGSGGRGENFLWPDQDNGFVLADYDDDQHDRIDGWFIAFAARMVEELDTVGIPRCRGGVMATSPLWRKTASQWQAQIELWTRKRGDNVLRLFDIFFDFAGIDGELSLARELRRFVTARVKARPGFLRELYRRDAEHRVALGWFGRLITERDIPLHHGKVNLKFTGTQPLIEAVRLLALREGIEDTSTIARIDALTAAGVLDADAQDELGGAYRHIARLLLRQQIADFHAGVAPSSYVAPGRLSVRERRLLVDSFKAIRRLRERVRSELTGELF